MRTMNPKTKTEKGSSISKIHRHSPPGLVALDHSVLGCSTTSFASTKRAYHGPDIERKRGIALILVMILLVLATSLTVELQYDSRVQLQMAANSRDALQAEYLARSAIEFTH